MKRTAVVLAVLGLCAGPAVAARVKNVLQIYDGPQRSRAEVAVLSVDKQPVWLAEVDGRKLHFVLHPGHIAYELLPGGYRLLVGHQLGEQYLPISFVAEAGKEYLLTDALAKSTTQWSPRIVEQPPKIDPELDRLEACWHTRERGTLVEYDCKAKRLSIQVPEAVEPRVFTTGGCGLGLFPLLDSDGRPLHAKLSFPLYKKIAPGAEVSVWHAACARDFVYALRLEP